MIAVSWRPGRRAAAAQPATEQGKRKRRFSDRRATNVALTLLVVSLVGVVLFPHMVITVPTGHAGVLWKRIYGFHFYTWEWGRGTVLNPREIRQEGLHLIWPWDVLYIYDLRLQTHTASYNAISKDGVSLTAQITIRFQLRNPALGVFHKFVGPAYLTTVVQPEIASRAREIIAQYDAEQVYSTRRQDVQDRIHADVQTKLADRLDRLVQPDTIEFEEAKKFRLKDSIVILDTLVLGIELPPTIVAAINRKVEQYYVVQEYAFRVEREKKEAERKAIEAEGVAAFQRTVVQGISDSYLRWRGIEATLELAKSPNSKVVIIGSNKDGLPIILGNLDSAPATAATPPADGSATPPADGTPPKTEPAPGTTTPPGTAPTTQPGASTPKGSPTAGGNPASPAGTAPTGGSGGTTAPAASPSTGTPAPGGTAPTPPGGKQPADGAKSSKAKSDQPSSSSSTWTDVKTMLSRLLGGDSGTAPAGKEASKAAR